METILAALAAAIIAELAADLGQRPGLAQLRERLRGDSPEAIALQRALANAYVAFVTAYPDLSASFFDEHFLSRPAVTAELSKTLTPNQMPDAKALEAIWRQQFRHNPRVALDAPLAFFLERYAAEVRVEPLLKPFVDSRAFRQLYVIAEYSETIVENSERQVTEQETTNAILAQIRDLLHQSKVANSMSNIPETPDTRSMIGGEMPMPDKPMTPARIFLSYASEDKVEVEAIYQRLSREGYHPWMDAKDILPGMEWPREIRRSIRDADLILACLSSHSVNKRGYLQRELKMAVDLWKEKIAGDIYLIPVRLEACPVPEILEDFQWVDLFKEAGWAHLLHSLEIAVTRETDMSEEPEPPVLNIEVEAPDGDIYSTAVPSDTLITDFLHAFLEQWHHPDATRMPAMRYTLVWNNADGPTLDGSLSLSSAGIVDHARLVIATESLTPESPISLTVEDDHGRRFLTAVRLSTSVQQLTAAFLRQTKQSSCQGDAFAELIGDDSDPLKRRLDPNRSLFDQQVRDEAILRILCLPNDDAIGATA